MNNRSHNADFLESNVHAEVDTGIRTEGYTLLRLLTQDMVHTDEKVHGLGMDVQYPAGAGGIVVQGHTDTAIQPLQWFPVGAQTSLCQRERSIKALLEQESECHSLVHGQLVFSTQTERCCQAFSNTALIAAVRDMHEVSYLVRVVLGKAP